MSSFPMVGIGASAGGLEAFTDLLKALSPTTGMAFVFVQHMEPEHKSLLPRLLSKITPMPVTEALNGIAVEPDHVYVIPPKSDMAVESGVIRIQGRRKTEGRYLPVDYLLSSLAEDRRDNAIGVLLSGTGSDGTIGLKAIKTEGGITLAQDEASSKYYGMPGNAIAAGCVDLILPPDRISKELARLARHPRIVLPQLTKPTELPAPGEDDLRRILHLLRTASGVDFTQYKPGTVRRRVARRMVLQKIESLKKYLGYLQQNRAELDALYHDILIHVTSFFREPEAFKVLQTRTFPNILADKKPRAPVRIWVPGCSTGEEVYSLAIALVEFLGDRASSTQIQIFGTDISEAAIEKARSGVYSEASLRSVSPLRVRRFFTGETDSGYRVNNTIREICVFARQDVTRDPPFSRIDLISCRNMLIYLGAAAQKRIVAAFHYALLDTGFLLVGRSEALTAYSDLFTQAEKKARIYARKPQNVQIAPVFSSPGYRNTPPGQISEEPPSYDALKEADRMVWQRYAHAGLVLNDDLEILHFRGETDPYLSHTSGKASLNALRMVRDELKMEVRSTIQRARRLKKPVRGANVRVRDNGAEREVSLEVTPLPGPESKGHHFLLLFDQLPPPVPAGYAWPVPNKARAAREAGEIARLRRELDASREYLRSVVEQQEASNEELKSANEEVLSSNEELQSTNEELETAKEELQSTNEELVTLNDTLQARNVEQSQLSDDLNNVLTGTTIPILIIGDDRRIRRFTPAAEKLLSLLPGDVGRPIGNIRTNFAFEDLDALMAGVKQTLTEQQREVRNSDGHWYSMRVRPYMTGDNRIDGVLIAFYDIDVLKHSTEAVQQMEATVSALVEEMVRAIVIVSSSGEMVLVNAGAEQMFGYRRTEMLGQPLEMLLPELYRGVHAENRAGYFGAPNSRTMALNRQASGRRKDGAEFPVEVNLNYIQAPHKQLAVAFIEDLTDRKRGQMAMTEKDAALQRTEELLHALTASLLTAQEEERERLARDLHDDLNQRLAALALQTGAIAQDIPESAADLKNRAQALHGALGTLSDDVRRIAHELHPAILEHFGLAAALRAYCEEFSQREDIRVQFRQRQLPETIPGDAALCLYRVTQECLGNIAKHSRVKEAWVALAGSPGAIRLAIRDRGVGFDPDRAMKGLGLVSIRERVRMCGGSIAVKSRSGEGTQIEVRIPLSGRTA